MPAKGRWGKKEAKAEPKAERVLPVRRTDHELPDAICIQIENLFTIAECEKYLELLKNEIEWQRQEIVVNKLDGRVIEGTEPRLTAFMADENICYEYSRRDNIGKGWNAGLVEIKKKVEKVLADQCSLPDVEFNCAQMNRYDGPRHSLGMHSDNEPDLVRNAPIASVSFGATRVFRILRRDDESKETLLSLADGCFLVMGGEMQRHYLHGVPPPGKGVGSSDHHGLRFNITFRCCIPRKPLEAHQLGKSALDRSRALPEDAQDEPETAKGKGYGKAAPAAPAAEQRFGRGRWQERDGDVGEATVGDE